MAAGSNAVNGTTLPAASLRHSTVAQIMRLDHCPGEAECHCVSHDAHEVETG